MCFTCVFASSACLLSTKELCNLSNTLVSFHLISQSCLHFFLPSCVILSCAHCFCFSVFLTQTTTKHLCKGLALGRISMRDLRRRKLPLSRRLITSQRANHPRPEPRLLSQAAGTKTPLATSTERTGSGRWTERHSKQLRGKGR